MRTLPILALLSICNMTEADTPALPQESRVPGGVFILPVDAPAELRPTVLFDGNRALVLRDGERWLAIVGIPLSAKPGDAQVLVQAGVQPGKPVKFEIAGKEYVTQRLKVAPGQVNLSKTNLARVQ